MRTWGSAAREAGAEQESIKACLGRGQKHHPPQSTSHNSAHQHLGGSLARLPPSQLE